MRKMAAYTSGGRGGGLIDVDPRDWGAVGIRGGGAQGVVKDVDARSTGDVGEEEGFYLWVVNFGDGGIE